MRNTSDPGLDGFLSKPTKDSLLVDAIAGIFDREIGVGSDHSLIGMRGGESDGSESLAGRRVLVVDDIEVNRDLAGELLADLGISTTMAVNGLAGVDRALAGTFDLVLMDIQMPEMDGLAATRLIPADQRFSNLPISAMTAHAMNRAPAIRPAIGRQTRSPHSRPNHFGRARRADGAPDGKPECAPSQAH
jgi:two-component system, sensor histidine kinase and response regulator